MMIRLVLYLFIGYTALILVMFFWQRRLLYFPDRNSPSQDQLQSIGLKSWPTTNAARRGYIAAQPHQANAGTVVIFHGNAGAAWQRKMYLDSLEPLHYRVVLAEYPGYGGRTGELGEKSFVADAQETVRLALHEFGGPLFIVAESLGCGIAAGVAVDSTIPIKGIALFTPWDTLPRLAQKIYWYLPVTWLIKDKYNNMDNLKYFSSRVAVIIAGQDEVIPKQHGLGLYNSLPGVKKLWLIPVARHNTWPSEMNGAWWEEIFNFLNQDGQQRK